MRQYFPGQWVFSKQIDRPENEAIKLTLSNALDNTNTIVLHFSGPQNANMFHMCEEIMNECDVFENVSLVFIIAKKQQALVCDLGETRVANCNVTIFYPKKMTQSTYITYLVLCSIQRKLILEIQMKF